VYRFDGAEYAIRRATCGGTICDPYWCDTYNGGRGKELFWWFEMEVECADPYEPAPSVNFDGVFIECSNWVQLVGKSVEWSSAIEASRETRYGWTTTYDCSMVVRGRLQIVERNSCVLRVIAQGEDEWENAFEIDANYRFEGIDVRGTERDDDASFRERLSQFLSLDHLAQQPIEQRGRYESGVQMAECRFLPIA